MVTSLSLSLSLSLSTCALCVHSFIKLQETPRIKHAQTLSSPSQKDFFSSSRSAQNGEPMSINDAKKAFGEYMQDFCPVSDLRKTSRILSEELLSTLEEDLINKVFAKIYGLLSMYEERESIFLLEAETQLKSIQHHRIECLKRVFGQGQSVAKQVKANVGAAIAEKKAEVIHAASEKADQVIEQAGKVMKDAKISLEEKVDRTARDKLLLAQRVAESTEHEISKAAHQQLDRAASAMDEKVNQTKPAAVRKIDQAKDAVHEKADKFIHQRSNFDIKTRNSENDGDLKAADEEVNVEEETEDLNFVREEVVSEIEGMRSEIRETLKEAGGIFKECRAAGEASLPLLEETLIRFLLLFQDTSAHEVSLDKLASIDLNIQKVGKKSGDSKGDSNESVGSAAQPKSKPLHILFTERVWDLLDDNIERLATRIDSCRKKLFQFMMDKLDLLENYEDKALDTMGEIFQRAKYYKEPILRCIMAIQSDISEFEKTLDAAKNLRVAFLNSHERRCLANIKKRILGPARKGIKELHSRLSWIIEQTRKRLNSVEMLVETKVLKKAKLELKSMQKRRREKLANLSFKLSDIQECILKPGLAPSVPRSYIPSQPRSRFNRQRLVLRQHIERTVINLMRKSAHIDTWKAWLSKQHGKSENPLRGKSPVAKAQQQAERKAAKGKDVVDIIKSNVDTKSGSVVTHSAQGSATEKTAAIAQNMTNRADHKATKTADGAKGIAAATRSMPPKRMKRIKAGLEHTESDQKGQAFVQAVSEKWGEPLRALHAKLKGPNADFFKTLRIEFLRDTGGRTIIGGFFKTFETGISSLVEFVENGLQGAAEKLKSLEIVENYFTKLKKKEDAALGALKSRLDSIQSNRLAMVQSFQNEFGKHLARLLHQGVTRAEQGLVSCSNWCIDKVFGKRGRVAADFISDQTRVRQYYSKLTNDPNGMLFLIKISSTTAGLERSVTEQCKLSVISQGEQHHFYPTQTSSKKSFIEEDIQKFLEQPTINRGGWPVMFGTIGSQVEKIIDNRTFQGIIYGTDNALLFIKSNNRFSTEVNNLLAKMGPDLRRAFGVLMITIDTEKTGIPTFVSSILHKNLALNSPLWSHPQGGGGIGSPPYLMMCPKSPGSMRLFTHSGKEAQGSQKLLYDFVSQCILGDMMMGNEGKVKVGMDTKLDDDNTLCKIFNLDRMRMCYAISDYLTKQGYAKRAFAAATNKFNIDGGMNRSPAEIAACLMIILRQPYLQVVRDATPQIWNAISTRDLRIEKLEDIELRQTIEKVTQWFGRERHTSSELKNLKMAYEVELLMYLVVAMISSTEKLNKRGLGRQFIRQLAARLVLLSDPLNIIYSKSSSFLLEILKPTLLLGAIIYMPVIGIIVSWSTEFEDGIDEARHGMRYAASFCSSCYRCVCSSSWIKRATLITLQILYGWGPLVSLVLFPLSATGVVQSIHVPAIDGISALVVVYLTYFQLGPGMLRSWSQESIKTGTSIGCFMSALFMLFASDELDGPFSEEQLVGNVGSFNSDFTLSGGAGNQNINDNLLEHLHLPPILTIFCCCCSNKNDRASQYDDIEGGMFSTLESRSSSSIWWRCVFWCCKRYRDDDYDSEDDILSMGLASDASDDDFVPMSVASSRDVSESESINFNDTDVKGPLEDYHEENKMKSYWDANLSVMSLLDRFEHQMQIRRDRQVEAANGDFCRSLYFNIQSPRVLFLFACLLAGTHYVIGLWLSVRRVQNTDRNINCVYPCDMKLEQYNELRLYLIKICMHYYRYAQGAVYLSLMCPLLLGLTAMFFALNLWIVTAFRNLEMMHAVIILPSTFRSMSEGIDFSLVLDSSQNLSAWLWCRSEIFNRSQERLEKLFPMGNVFKYIVLLGGSLGVVNIVSAATGTFEEDLAFLLCADMFVITIYVTIILFVYAKANSVLHEDVLDFLHTEKLQVGNMKDAEQKITTSTVVTMQLIESAIKKIEVSVLHVSGGEKENESRLKRCHLRHNALNFRDLLYGCGKGDKHASVEIYCMRKPEYDKLYQQLFGQRITFAKLFGVVSTYGGSLVIAGISYAVRRYT
eukprot:jgi/Bigna1/72184/fgenesh1_pg.18_\